MANEAETLKAPEGTGRSWHAPHLVAGRSHASTTILLVMVFLGFATDTTAFKTVLDLVLRSSEALSWVMATGLSCSALTLAWVLGVKWSGLRHGDRETTANEVRLLAVVWVGLGAALLYVRWTSGAGNVAPVFETVGVDTTAIGDAHSSGILFAILYLASGLVTVMESALLNNPAYTLFARSATRLFAAQEGLSVARGEAERAQAAFDHHQGELDRELERRNQAWADRQALAAEAANYGRVRMAQLMADPRKTGVTETGPVASGKFDAPESAA